MQEKVNERKMNGRATTMTGQKLKIARLTIARIHKTGTMKIKNPVEITAKYGTNDLQNAVIMFIYSRVVMLC
jgi:hypothetical protein